VRLQTPPSFAKRWLLPRLPALLERHPTLDIRVNAEGGGAFEPGSADLTILYGDSRRWRTHALPLLEEQVQPLCAPSLLQRRPIATAADLLAQTLIETRVNVLTWKAWLPRYVRPKRTLAASAPAAAVAARIIRLDPSDVAIEAATRGLGVVLESDVLTETERAEGRLLAPLPALARPLRSYWLAPLRPAPHTAVQLVRGWLFEIAIRQAEAP
jgi:LysR family glycine cleavage system transcriptional activator